MPAGVVFADQKSLRIHYLLVKLHAVERTGSSRESVSTITEEHECWSSQIVGCRLDYGSAQDGPAAESGPRTCVW